MDTLPNEMLENMLGYLDVLDLAKVSTVSKRWYEIVERVIHRAFKYYVQCRKKIPKKYWVAILERQTNREIRLDALDSLTRHQQTWKSMYQSWIGWNTLLDKTPKHTTLQVTTNHITCLDVTGNIIAIGSMFSTGCFYDLTKPQDGPFFVMPCPVNGVWFWRKGNDIRAVTYTETIDTTVIKYWDVVAKKRILMDAYKRPSLISTSLDYCYTLIPFLTNDVDIENYEARTSYNLIVNRIGSKLDFRTMRIPKIGFVNFITAEGDQILMSTKDYHEGRINVYLNSSTSGFELVHSSPWRLRQNGHVDIGKSRVLWTTGVDGLKIGFSVDYGEWKFYDVTRDLKLNSSVTKILVHLGLLFLGLESGDVKIVQVEDRLDDLNLETMRSMTLKFTPDPVTHLNVTEHESKQYLVVASMLELHVVEFQTISETDRAQEGCHS